MTDKWLLLACVVSVPVASDKVLECQINNNLDHEIKGLGMEMKDECYT